MKNLTGSRSLGRLTPRAMCGCVSHEWLLIRQTQSLAHVKHRPNESFENEIKTKMRRDNCETRNLSSRFDFHFAVHRKRFWLWPEKSKKTNRLVMSSHEASTTHTHARPTDRWLFSASSRRQKKKTKKMKALCWRREGENITVTSHQTKTQLKFQNDFGTKSALWQRLMVSSVRHILFKNGKIRPKFFTWIDFKIVRMESVATFRRRGWSSVVVFVFVHTQ